MLFESCRLLLVTGHYGCGKTNFSMNLAMDLAKQGKRVTLMDLDVVNPYFRTSDYAPLLRQRGVGIIAPQFAHSNLDIPSLPAEMYAALEPAWPADAVILDVGGDDAGATALGRFSSMIGAQPYEMLYVVNKNRPLTETPQEAVALLREVETAARLKATAIINNTHLQGGTTLQTVLDAYPYGVETAKAAGLPLAAVTVPQGVEIPRETVSKWEQSGVQAYPVKRYVLPPWEPAVF